VFPEEASSHPQHFTRDVTYRWLVGNAFIHPQGVQGVQLSQCAGGQMQGK